MRTNVVFAFTCFLLSTIAGTSFAQSSGMLIFSPEVVCVGEVVRISPVCPVNNNGVSLTLPQPIDDYTVVASLSNGVKDVVFHRAGTYYIQANVPNCSVPVIVKPLTVYTVPVSLPTATLSFNYCQTDPVTLTIPGYSNAVTWHAADGTQLRVGSLYEIGYLQPGTYSYKARTMNPGSCDLDGSFISETSITVTVTTYCDYKYNWTESISFNETGAEVSHSKAYFDITGEMLQSQSKSYAANAIVTSETVKDKYDRSVVATLPIPLVNESFGYRYGLLRNQAGAKYGYQNIGQPVDQSTPGTIGWYYSSNNTLEQHVPTTEHPYSRVTFYNDGTTEQKMSGGVGEILGIGSGHEVVSGSFPVVSELQDYLAKRTVAIPGIVQDNSLRYEGVVNIGRDQNGKYAVSITDREGKTVMTALPALPTDTTTSAIKVTNVVLSSGDTASVNFRQSTYFYLLHEHAVTITGSSDFVVENIVTDERKPAGQTFAAVDGNWPVGFYRVILNNSASNITLTYTNYFKDISYQFYDDAGRLKTSLSPNGFVQVKQGTAFNLVDKTDYTYNFRGWLLETKEPDAGISKFKYRKDGSIRFSQNALQASNNHFSYTAYDQLGRPVESGEYIGTQKTFTSSASELEYATQAAYPLSDKKDWIITKYDEPDQDFITAWTNSPYKQTFIRGGVSCSQNANSKTWYSYDDMGRSAWIARKPTNLKLLFVTTYQYDFLGNVLRVSNFTHDWDTHAVVNEFHHHYEYDADQRLKKAYTSLTQSGSKKLRATYFYYLHGPLKRIELGDKLQGVDFVYNIQGWLTQINHPLKSEDPGDDANDAFGMILDYYESDIPNLLSGKVSPQNPLRHHRLTEDMMASHMYKQPLPRFAPDVPQPDPGLDPLLKKYSAENSAYQQMISNTVPSHN